MIMWWVHDNLVTICRISDDYLLIIWLSCVKYLFHISWLSDDHLMTFWWLGADYLLIMCWLYIIRLSHGQYLLSDHLMTIWRLYAVLKIFMMIMIFFKWLCVDNIIYIWRLSFSGHVKVILCWWLGGCWDCLVLVTRDMQGWYGFKPSGGAGSDSANFEYVRGCVI